MAVMGFSLKDFSSAGSQILFLCLLVCVFLTRIWKYTLFRRSCGMPVKGKVGTETIFFFSHFLERFILLSDRTF